MKHVAMRILSSLLLVVGAVVGLERTISACVLGATNCLAKYTPGDPPTCVCKCDITISGLPADTEGYLMFCVCYGCGGPPGSPPPCTPGTPIGTATTTSGGTLSFSSVSMGGCPSAALPVTFCVSFSYAGPTGTITETCCITKGAC